MQRHSHLPRLARTAYQGGAIVHWTLCMKDRVTGWLDPLFHASFREFLLHACALYEVVCPVYTLMPDHMHMIWMGLASTSDQRIGMRFLRRGLNERLEGIVLAGRQAQLQKQGYDHVLRKEERERGAFEKVAWYIQENPVRAGLVEDAKEWPFTGCMVVGHPGWNVFHERFWDTFWDWYAEHASYGG